MVNLELNLCGIRRRQLKDATLQRFEEGVRLLSCGEIATQITANPMAELGGKQGVSSK